MTFAPPDPPLRVGLVGANPDRGWGAAVHAPVLAHLPEFQLTAVATTRQESAEASAARFGARHAFTGAAALAQCPDVDLVVVAVKAPDHHQAVLAALDAGKHVYCEWPLAASTAQAMQMRDAAARASLSAMVGLQARAAPALTHARRLLADGWIGELVSVQMRCSIPGGGARRSQEGAYVIDAANGATTISIHGGHAIDALTWITGPFAELSSVVANQFPQVTLVEIGETRAKSAPDHALVAGRLASGALASIHLNGGVVAGAGVRIVLFGTEGVLELETEGVHNLQMAPVRLRGARSPAKVLEPIAPPADLGAVDLDLGGAASAYPGVDTPPATWANVARMYQNLGRAIRSGEPLLADFGDGVRMHEMLDAMAASSAQGQRLTSAG